MTIDVKQLRSDVQRQSRIRVASPIGKRKTGATEVLRALRDEIITLHANGALWSEIAAALAAQGLTQGDGLPMTGRRLTALLKNIERQLQKKARAASDRASRKDLAIKSEKMSTGRLTLADELRSRPTINEQQVTITEDAIRQEALARHAEILRRK